MIVTQGAGRDTKTKTVVVDRTPRNKKWSYAVVVDTILLIFVRDLELGQASLQ